MICSRIRTFTNTPAAIRRARMLRARAGSAGRGTRRAFTLLELMLAVTLGGIIVFSALGIFTLLDKANKLQEARLMRTQELAVARRTIANAFRSLIMADTAAPRDDDLKQRIDNYVADAETEEGRVTRDEDSTDSRLSLQPDITRIGPNNLPMQALEMTVRTSPILGGMREIGVEDPENMTNEQIHAMLVSGRVPSSFDRAAYSSESRPAGETAAERRAARQAEREERARGGDASAALLAAEPPRAPGIRGVFELRPDSESMRPGQIDLTEPETWSLWWRELPRDVASASNPLDPAANGIDAPPAGRSSESELRALERQSRSDGREIKLLSGLTEAEWSVFQRGKFIPKANAKHLQELPAFAEFAFKTVDGRDEHWLFEVSWTTGPEPGLVMSNVTDPLAVNSGVDIAGIIQGAIDRAGREGINGVKPGDTGTPTAATGGTGQGTAIASAGGKNGAGGTGSGTGMTPTGSSTGGGTTQTGGVPTLQNPGLPPDIWARILEVERQRNGGRR